MVLFPTSGGCMCRQKWWLFCPCRVQAYCPRTENVSVPPWLCRRWKSMRL